MQNTEINYQVLARKYRPQTFETMVGQEHVVLPLVNALNKKRLHHAYLFTGTRGVGKTSVARIIAKCLNCEVGVSANPCGQCNACQEIDNGNFVDLIEVDAASRTRVEDTRELLDNVQYVPTRGRYKIYLIDEVHMLSGHSFNALLKTLEEPPRHVKFLLATTDPQKLPATVLSRCLQFHLKNLRPDCITDYLQHVLEKEHIDFETEALSQIAHAADGSMRDALSLLDQAISFGQGKITTVHVSTMLGTVGQNHIFDLLNALAVKDGKALLEVTSKLAENAIDFSNVLEELVSFLYRIAVAQIIPEANVEADAANKFRDLFSKKDIQLYYQIALIGRRDLSLAPDAKSGFEMVLLRMLAFRPVSMMDQKGTQKKTITESKGNVNIQQQTKSYENKSQLSGTLENWSDFIVRMQLNGMTYTLASNCVLKSASKEKIEFILNKQYAALLNDKLHKRLNNAINRELNSKVELVIHIGETEVETPAQQEHRQATERHKIAIETIESDLNVKEMVEKLGVIVEPNLVKSIESKNE